MTDRGFEHMIGQTIQHDSILERLGAVGGNQESLP